MLPAAQRDTDWENLGSFGARRFVPDDQTNESNTIYCRCVGRGLTSLLFLFGVFSEIEKFLMMGWFSLASRLHSGGSLVGSSALPSHVSALPARGINHDDKVSIATEDIASLALAITTEISSIPSTASKPFTSLSTALPNTSSTTALSITSPTTKPSTSTTTTGFLSPSTIAGFSTSDIKRMSGTSRAITTTSTLPVTAKQRTSLTTAERINSSATTRHTVSKPGTSTSPIKQRTSLTMKQTSTATTTPRHFTSSTIDGPSTSTAKQRGSCSRFLILTTQRSGSTHLEEVMEAWPQTVVGKEGFNMYETHFGGIVRGKLGLSKEDVVRMGAVKWADVLFNDLETKGRTSKTLKPGEKCVVGFQIMGLVDKIRGNQVLPLLLDASIKKVVLRRGNIQEQWLSLQRALCVGDWGDHHRVMNKSQREAKFAELLRQGKHCGGKEWEFKTYRKNKYFLYKGWNDTFARSGQKAFYLMTETEDQNLQKLKSFLLDEAAPNR